MIPFSGQITEAEFRHAQWLSSPGWVRWFGWFILALIPLVLATGGWRPMLEDPASQLPRLVLILVFGILMIVLPRRAINRVWRNTPLLHELVTGTLSEDGVLWETTSTSATYAWDKIVRRQVAADMILLYTSERQALVLPRRYFAREEDWSAAAALVSSSGPQ